MPRPPQTAVAEEAAAQELCRFRDGFGYPPDEFDLVTCAWCYAYAGPQWFAPDGRLQIGQHLYRRKDGSAAVTYVSPRLALLPAAAQSFRVGRMAWWLSGI